MRAVVRHLGKPRRMLNDDAMMFKLADDDFTAHGGGGRTPRTTSPGWGAASDVHGDDRAGVGRNRGAFAGAKSAAVFACQRPSASTASKRSGPTTSGLFELGGAAFAWPGSVHRRPRYEIWFDRSLLRRDRGRVLAAERSKKQLDCRSPVRPHDHPALGWRPHDRPGWDTRKESRTPTRAEPVRSGPWPGKSDSTVTNKSSARQPCSPSGRVVHASSSRGSMSTTSASARGTEL